MRGKSTGTTARVRPPADTVPAAQGSRVRCRGLGFRVYGLGVRGEGLGAGRHCGCHARSRSLDTAAAMHDPGA